MMNFVCRPLGDIYRQKIKNHNKNRSNSVCEKDPKNVSIWNLIGSNSRTLFIPYYRITNNIELKSDLHIRLNLSKRKITKNFKCWLKLSPNHFPLL